MFVLPEEAVGFRRFKMWMFMRFLFFFFVLRSNITIGWAKPFLTGLCLREKWVIIRERCFLTCFHIIWKDSLWWKTLRFPIRLLCSGISRQHAGCRLLQLSWCRREGRGSRAVTFVAAGQGCECSLDLTEWTQRGGLAAWLGRILTERPVGKRGCVAQLKHFEDVWGIWFCSLLAQSPVAGLNRFGRTSSHPVGDAQGHPATL